MEFKDIKPFVRFARQLEIKENSAFPEYFPLDARLFYVLNGEGKIKVGNDLLTLPTGSALFINAGVCYTLLPCSAVYSAVNFDFTFSFSHLTTPIPPVNTALATDEKPLERVSISDSVCFNEYSLFLNLHSLQQKMLRLENEYGKKLPFFQFECSYILSSVLITLARRAEQRLSKEKRFDIEQILEYIHAHYNEPIDNGTLSRVFNFHPNYINAEFKNSIGKSLHGYVLETRIMKAVGLMESGESSISEIAVKCGFSDSNYFSRYFKKVMGISPAKYMKNSKI